MPKGRGASGSPETGPFGKFVAAVENDQTVMLENLVATSSLFDITYATPEADRVPTGICPMRRIPQRGSLPPISLAVHLSQKYPAPLIE